MKVQTMSEQEFFFIKENLELFWGDRKDVFDPLHHQLFYRSFGNTTFVIKEGDEITAYMLGFYSQKESKAYVHMINVREPFRGRGYGRELYRHFSDIAREKGCEKIGAITSPSNELSILFHQSIGMNLLGEKNENGITVVADYAGAGRDNVVFEMDL